MLRMASGVPFEEIYDGKDDLAKFNKIRFAKEIVTALRAFTDARGRAGHALSLCVQPDDGADAVLRAATGIS